MIPVNVRKQGGAAIMTIPANLMRLLGIEIGDSLELGVDQGNLTARPVRQGSRARYTLAELLRGVSKEKMAKLNAGTAWALKGGPVGRGLS